MIARPTRVVSAVTTGEGVARTTVADGRGDAVGEERRGVGDRVSEGVRLGAGVVDTSVAVAVLVGRASEGEFTGWKDSLTGFVQMLAYAPLLYCVRQFVVGSVILGHRPVLRGGPLDQAIGRERNAGLAAVEAATYLGTALLVHVVDRT